MEVFSFSDSLHKGSPKNSNLCRCNVCLRGPAIEFIDKNLEFSGKIRIDIQSKHAKSEATDVDLMKAELFEATARGKYFVSFLQRQVMTISERENTEKEVDKCIATVNNLYTKLAEATCVNSITEKESAFEASFKDFFKASFEDDLEASFEDFKKVLKSAEKFKSMTESIKGYKLPKTPY
jgi:hypothetical protein